jgi:predicted RNA binding protein YcfA (HicA-like mRNA interferase family)
LKLFKKNGVIFDSHGKRHDLYYSSLTGKTFPVPRHKTEIAEGTLKSILTDAGIKIGGVK